MVDPRRQMQDLPTKRSARRRFMLAASLVVAVGFGWVLRAGGLPVVPRGAAFVGIGWGDVALQALLYCIALYLRAHRWAWLLAPLERVPLRRVVAVSFIGYGALVLMPFRTGEAVRPLLIRKRGLSGWAVAGTVAAERIVDGVVLSLLLLAGLWLAPPQSPLPDSIGDLPVPAAMVPRAAKLALVLFGAAFAVIFVFWARRKWARRMTELVIGLVSPRLAIRLADTVEHIASGLDFLPTLRYTLPFLAATVGYFALCTWGIERLLVATGLEHGGFAKAAAIVGVLHIGVLLPNAPGYFGTFQVSMYAALSLYFAPTDVMSRGGALVFFSYVTQVGLAVLLGLVALAVEGASLSDTLESADAADGAPAGPLPGA